MTTETTKTNGYIAFYSNQQIEVHAETQYAAKLKAEAEFRRMFPRRKLKSWDVTVMIAERDTAGGTRTGEPVLHSTASLD